METTLPKIFVSGFPLDINELDLAKLIAPHGDIATIKIVRDKQTRICKGYAFVEMATLTGAENAVIALDGSPMQDRELTVKINEERPVAVRPRFNRPNTDRRPAYGHRSDSRPASNTEERTQRPRRPRV
jgi:RNA recognition motif-containing protein